MRYLARVWPNRDEIADIRQETYARVYESVQQTFPSAPKSFLFTCARNLMADRIRRSRIVFIGTRGDLDALNVLIDDISPEQRLTAHQELNRLARAFDSLPPKCRQVTWLRKVEQRSQRDVALYLGVQEKAIEKQVSRGMRLLARALLEGPNDDEPRASSPDSRSKDEHGQP